jgi:hypothetical protein
LNFVTTSGVRGDTANQTIACHDRDFYHHAWDAQRTTVRLCSALLAAGVTLLLILAVASAHHQDVRYFRSSSVSHAAAISTEYPPLLMRKHRDSTCGRDVRQVCVRYATNQPRHRIDKRCRHSCQRMYLSLPPSLQTIQATLDISPQSIARAYQASKSELQQRAEASGKTLKIPAPDKYERLAERFTASDDSGMYR